MVCFLLFTASAYNKATDTLDLPKPVPNENIKFFFDLFFLLLIAINIAGAAYHTVGGIVSPYVV
jgi:hypothetical protein